MNDNILLCSMLFSSTYLFSHSLKIMNEHYLNNRSIILNMMNCFFLSFSAGIMINTLDKILLKNE